MERNHLCNFTRGHYGEHSCKVLFYFRPVVRLNKRFMDDGRMPDAGKRPITIAHQKPSAHGELKKDKISEANPHTFIHRNSLSKNPGFAPVK